MFQICPVCDMQQDIEPYDVCQVCGYEWTPEDIYLSTFAPIERPLTPKLPFTDTSAIDPDADSARFHGHQEGTAVN